uniref:Uncharacterized protein n=1 Tax=Timema tahoe TaxID=61484 RepID=A0A7R9IUE2_9NEOP|nr:unnamed protein product [Timema tahoe]
MSHYSSRRKIKQLPVILRIDGVSRVTCRHPWSQGLVQDYLTIRYLTSLSDWLNASQRSFIHARDGQCSSPPGKLVRQFQHTFHKTCPDMGCIRIVYFTRPRPLTLTR